MQHVDRAAQQTSHFRTTVRVFARYLFIFCVSRCACNECVCTILRSFGLSPAPYINQTRTALAFSITSEILIGEKSRKHAFCNRSNISQNMRSIGVLACLLCGWRCGQALIWEPRALWMARVWVAVSPTFDLGTYGPYGWSCVGGGVANP